MSEWDVRYVKTRQGRNVAVGIMGTGPLIVVTPPSLMVSNFQRSTNFELFTRLAQKCTVVTYDHVGAGLSDRHGFDFSPGALVEELDAVVGSLAESPVAVFGWSPNAHTAIRFTVANPRRVRSLALVGWPCGADYVSTPAFVPYRTALESDWETASEYFTLIHGEVHGDDAKRKAAFIRETTSFEAHLCYLRAYAASDVTDLLPFVSAPTLVLQPRSHPFYIADFGVALAAGIPGAHLSLVEFGQTAFDDVPDFVHQHARSKETACKEVEADPELTPRETAVLALAARGMTNAAIAGSLVIAEATVARHMHNILTKLGLRGRTAAATWWAHRN